MRAILPRLFLVFLAAVSVVVLTGCANNQNLHFAAFNGDVNLTRRLIEKGANVNEDGDDCQTPLCDVITHSDSGGLMLFGGDQPGARTQIASLLIEKGANVNVACTSKLSPLAKAAEFGQTQIAKLLIEKGANVNFANWEGTTPLILAVQMGHMDTAKVLLQNGANPLLRDRSGKIALDYEQYGQDYRKAVRENKEQSEREHIARIEQQREQKRRDKAESREFWKGVATLATGVAVGKATSGYTPDQQSRMMSSSMKAVDSGDTSELTETTNQVKAEQAQSHNAKMQAIEAQKERDRAAQAQDNRVANANVGSYTPKLAPLSHPSSTKYRCVEKSTGGSFPKRTEAEARAEALQYTKIVEGGMGNLKTISTEITSCKHEEGLGFTCHALTKYERDSIVPCGGRSGPGGGKSK